METIWKEVSFVYGKKTYWEMDSSCIFSYIVEKIICKRGKIKYL